MAIPLCATTTWALVEAGRSNRLRFVSALQDAGACLLAGTDTPNPFVVPGFSLHDELANFEAAGFDRGRITPTTSQGRIPSA